MVFCSVTQFIFSFPGSGFVDERKEAYVLSKYGTYLHYSFIVVEGIT